MKPNADLVVEVAKLQKKAAEEVEKLAVELAAAVVFPNDYQPPEQEEQMRIDNLKAQYRRATWVLSQTVETLTSLVKANKS